MLEQFEELIGFLQGYADFFEDIVKVEKDKLSALFSYELKRMEKSMAEQQAVEKQLQNMEKKREEMQEHAQVGGKTFREIAEIATGQEKEKLRELFERIQQAMDEIKLYNGKSLEFVRSNLKTIGSNYNQDGLQDIGYSRLAKAAKPTWSATKTIFETKI